MKLLHCFFCLQTFQLIPPDPIRNEFISVRGDSDDSILSSPPISPFAETAGPSGFMVPMPRPSSAPPSDNSKEPLSVKRGGKRYGALNEAVQVMKEIAAQPIAPPKEDDSASLFGNFVAGRLREIETESGVKSRRDCECEIMRLLSQY